MRGLLTGAAAVSLLMGACAPETAQSEDGTSEEVATDGAEQGRAPELLTLDDSVGESAERVDGAAPDGSASFDPECLIEGPGAAGIVMPDTLGDFAAAFPQGTALSFYSAFMVDLSALCVRSDGADAICAIAFAEDSYAPDTEAQGLIVSSPVCNTSEGVGPGTPVSTAVEAYGAATFGFSWDNEGREYVSFANPPGHYSFRARSDMAEENAENGGVNMPGGEHGGDYRGVEGDGSYYETTAGYPDAVIREVWISWPVD